MKKTNTKLTFSSTTVRQLQQSITESQLPAVVGGVVVSRRPANTDGCPSGNDQTGPIVC